MLCILNILILWLSNGSCFDLQVSADFDDSRNTDNAWLETKIINFHDEDGNITKNLNLVRNTCVL